MRDETVSKNYAATLFELAQRSGRLEEFEEGVEMLARMLDENPSFRLFLDTPRIDAQVKKDAIRKVFGDAFPGVLLNFVLITVDKRRQRLLREIARQFHGLVDEHEGRTHVEIRVARELEPGTLDEIASRLSGMLGKEAIPHVRIRPELLGGIVIRAGDLVYDGSLRRRLEGMRRKLQSAELPEIAALDAET